MLIPNFTFLSRKNPKTTKPISWQFFTLGDLANCSFGWMVWLSLLKTTWNAYSSSWIETIWIYFLGRETLSESTCVYTVESREGLSPSLLNKLCWIVSCYSPPFCYLYQHSRLFIYLETNRTFRVATSTHDKGCITEERSESKGSRSVLQTSRMGDCPT